MTVSKRLRHIAQAVPRNRRVADIACDHALLSAWLVEQEIASSVIAGELRAGPFAAACRTVRERSLAKAIEVRLGDGLSILRPAEVEVVILAGIGGPLTAAILERGRSSLRGVERLVLQPSSSPARLRAWLCANNWELETESLVDDGPFIYDLLTAKPGDGVRPYRDQKFPRHVLLELGPFHLRAASQLFLRRCRNQRRFTAGIASELRKSKSQAAEHKLKIVEELLASLDIILADND